MSEREVNLKENDGPRSFEKINRGEDQVRALTEDELSCFTIYLRITLWPISANVAANKLQLMLFLSQWRFQRETEGAVIIIMR